MLKLFKKNTNLEYEFLPAVLEISETPASPLGSTIIWLIAGIITAAVLWSCLGSVDEVAVARGKVVPDGRIKVVQPLEEGIVTVVHVSEGQRVKEGQVLIELDSTMKEVDMDSLEKAIEIERVERDLLKKALEGGSIAELISQADLSDEFRENLLRLNESKDQEYRVKHEGLALAVSQSESEIEITKEDMEKLENRIVMLKQKEMKQRELLNTQSVEEASLIKLEKEIGILIEDEKILKKLYEEGAVSKKEWEAKFNQMELSEKEYETQKAKIRREKNSLELNLETAIDEIALTQKELQTQSLRIEQATDRWRQAVKNLENFEKERNSTIFNLIVEKDKRISGLEAEITKAQKSIQLKSLVAPVSGMVHSLSANTIGGVLTPAQPVMSIVPEGTTLVIEASLPNKDIGFVSVGNEAAVKFDTFPFQKYGTIKGKVLSISPDAFEDERMGYVYKMRVSIEKTSIWAHKTDVDITPGMTAVVEIKTGKKKL
ncbi:MAG: HlyD family efflux transporter periplasmic adaptor subunit, partial [Clostridiaceae bacterium]|nr:HlyD family efflux transporter periplasmic adaptor subunit [Clostridiaceae bacterium]